MNPTRSLCMIAGLAAVVVVGGASTPAAAADSGWKLRASGLWVEPDFSWEEVSEYGERQSATASGELGFGLGLEYRVSGRLGIEASVAWVAPEIVVSLEQPPIIDVSSGDGLESTTIGLALNIHLTPNAVFDLYLAPTISYVFYGDLTFDLGMFCDPDMLCLFPFEVGDEVGWGGALGVDVPLGQGGWLLNGSVAYQSSDIEVTDPDGDSESFGFDPITIALGVAYRF